LRCLVGAKNDVFLTVIFNHEFSKGTYNKKMEIISHSLLSILLFIFTIVTPLVCLFVAFKLPKDGLSLKPIVLVIFLQLFTTGLGYMTLQSGGIEEDKVENIVGKKYLTDHESMAEVMVGLSSLASILTVTAYFLAPIKRSPLLVVAATLGLVSSSVGVMVHMNGKLITEIKQDTPGYDKKSQSMNKLPGNFSVIPSVNESLNKDDNDYGNEDEGLNEDDDKQED
jgi:hypothetical protein